MNTLAIWVPPKNDSIYHTQTYLYCRKCSNQIKPGTVMGVDMNDLTRLGSEVPYNPECTLCALKTFMQDPGARDALLQTVREELKFGNILREQVREELRKIIKEEVYDPNGTFSPDGPK